VNTSTLAWRRAVQIVGAAALTLLLAACGGAGGGDAMVEGQDRPAADTDAARFLHQATFGATSAEIATVRKYGYTSWIEDQFRRPRSLHRDYMDRRQAERAAANEGSVSQDDFFESWWAQAVTGRDQLRQRVAFALSQIFVVSYTDGTVSNYPRGVASYYDMLAANAFGNYRTLLEDVSLHPMMGLYLSHLRNQKEDLQRGRVPDENYAREIMQLFSIGLVELNIDGTPRLVNGQAVETYTHADVQGLAKVFTGWSWYAGPTPADRTSRRFFGNDAHPERDVRPMQSYNRHAANTDFHSSAEKSFLGRTIPAVAQGQAPDPEGDLRIALDTLFNHPNVGPFFCRQLIQRLVASNPSPGYVSRCAQAFNGGGGTPRGDMKAVIRAILLDAEARAYNPDNPQAGKLREPVLRLANWMRAFNATSVDATGRFRGIGNTDAQNTRLGQTPMRSASVFNFFRPGYTPPNTSIATAGLVAPELQIAHEVSVAGYLNYMRSSWVPLSTSSSRFVRQTYDAELALVNDPAALVDRVNLLLAAGQLSQATRTEIVDAVASRVIPEPRRNTAGEITNQATIDAARRDRVYIAVFLTLAAPDYLALK
jgi:uncharacterized protein (DUF1800 family)